jgi:hypothetical protein
VEVRRTAGGPAPDQTGRAVEAARLALADDRSWLARTRESLAAAQARLRQRSEQL